MSIVSARVESGYSSGYFSGKVDSVCPECGSGYLVRDEDVGEVVCGSCGFVIGDMILDRAPEWRAFNLQESADRSRVGSPSSLAISDKGLHTTLGNVYRETRGQVSAERKWQLLRLSRWQRKVSGEHFRNLGQAMNVLTRIVSHLQISRGVQEQAALFYRRALKEELVRGRSIEMVMSACLYAACRVSGTQRGLKDIAEYVSCDKMDVARVYRVIYNRLGLSVPRPVARDRVPKIASRVDISQGVQLRALELLRFAEEERITAGKDPDGLAAAALYIACREADERCTQKDIAFAAGVTEVTIRNRYKGMVEELGLVI